MKAIQESCKLISIMHAYILKQKANQAVVPETLMFYLQVSRRVLQCEEFYSRLLSLPDLAQQPLLLSSFPAPCYGSDPDRDRGRRKSCRETSPARTAPDPPLRTGVPHVSPRSSPPPVGSPSAAAASAPPQRREKPMSEREKGDCASSVPGKRINVTFKIRKWIQRNLC